MVGGGLVHPSPPSLFRRGENMGKGLKRIIFGSFWESKFPDGERMKKRDRDAL